jgi:hypothetical protein
LRRHRAKMTRVEGMSSSSSSSSSSSEDENEKEEEEDITKCCVCNEQMFNRAPSLMCITCEEINKRDMKRNRKEKKKQEKGVTMPKLERIDNQDEESKQALKNAIQNEKVKIENEQRLKLQNDNKENDETVTGVHYDVLGTVMRDLFTEGTLRTMQIGQIEGTYSNRDMQYAVQQTQKELGKFSGDIMKSAQWLSDFCMAVYRFKFRVSECLQVITACFTKEAKAWLSANIDEASKDE